MLFDNKNIQIIEINDSKYLIIDKLNCISEFDNKTIEKIKNKYGATNIGRNKNLMLILQKIDEAEFVEVEVN